MRKSVYIVDLIGTHSGMDYYLDSFKDVIVGDEVDVKILSNYSYNDKPFFVFIYNRTKIVSILLFLYSFLKLFLHIVVHRKDTYIYLSYGEITDFLFFALSLISKSYYVDIHEVYADAFINNVKIKKLFDFYYKHIIKRVIYHSDKTEIILNQIPYKGLKLYVPHFKYSFDKEYCINNIGVDILSHFRSDKLKYLFFGNLRKVKGIDIIVDYFTNNDYSKNIELVIAGKNVENIRLDQLREKYGILDRHINDDELKYLYSKTDFVLLPYRDSSQSGILEMAFIFRKPMLLSDIPYFSTIISKYPSFGEIESLDKYTSLLEKIIEGDINHDYYSEKDCNSFLMKEEIILFKKEFIKSLGQ